MGHEACEPQPEAVRRLTYLLPIRSDREPTEELTHYLSALSRVCPVIVVDGSEPHIFDAAHRSWGSIVTHVSPHADITGCNGKVCGVLTGVRLVRTEHVVIADDDVRYTTSDLVDVEAALATADLVVPQNYFEPLPWHARWDTARTLINRATGGDFPGTLALRTDLVRSGGYDGDVLFENLELMRTVRARGGRCVRRPDLYVRRLPPSTGHFVGQRIRQAYDEFARPIRLGVWLAVLPLLLLASRRRAAALMIAVGSVGLAEVGRRAHGGSRHFPVSATFAAPMWVAERSVCAWLAMFARCRGGVTYGGGRICRAANTTRSLRRRVAVSSV